MAEKKSYHFDLGNSTDGPIGFCASIMATSKEEALERLKWVLPDDALIAFVNQNGERGDQREYVSVYFNSDKITVNDIDDEFRTE